MNYSLLTNSTYLYLLKHPGASINYSAIAREVHLTRQTVAKEYQFLINNNIDYQQNEMGIKNFYLEVPNPNERAICIFLELNGLTTVEELARKLNIATSTVSIYFESAKARTGMEKEAATTLSGVYALLANNEIIYIGSTCNLKHREKQHYQYLSSLPTDTNMIIYSYCKQNDLSPKSINFVPLLYTNDYAEMERAMIAVVRPVCNVNK